MPVTTADRKRRAYLRRIPGERKSLSQLFARQRAAIQPGDINDVGRVLTSVRARWERELLEWAQRPGFRAAFETGIKTIGHHGVKRIIEEVGYVDAAWDAHIVERSRTIGKLADVNAAAIRQAYLGYSEGSGGKLAKNLKDAIGLHPRQVKALDNQMAVIRKRVPPAKWDMWERRLYKKKLQYRAELIARTEMSDASNSAQMIGMREKIKRGEVSPGTKKKWSTSGKKNVCPRCERNEMEGFVPMDHEFSSGHDRPPAHPNCVCAMEFSAREDTPERPAPVVRLPRPKPRLKPKMSAGEYLDSLTDTHAEQLKNASLSWTGTDYKNMRQIDRGGILNIGGVINTPGLPFLDENRAQNLADGVAALNSMFGSVKPFHGKTYRGMVLTQDKLDKILGGVKVSDDLIMDALSSTSDNPAIADYFATIENNYDIFKKGRIHKVLFEIDGKSGVDINGLPRDWVEKKEREILFQGGSKFKIESIVKTDQPEDVDGTLVNFTLTKIKMREI